MLNMLTARMMLNAQYAHCMCAARHLTCSKKTTRCPIALNKCM